MIAETKRKMEKAVQDWFGYPTRSAYWWDHKRERPKVPGDPIWDDVRKAWASVRDAVEIPPGLSPAEADAAARTTPSVELK